VAEPDPDRGHIDGPAPDEVAFVVPAGDGAVPAELTEGTLDGVALRVGEGVEGGWAAAVAAAPQPVAGLVGGSGDGGFDAASLQVSVDRAAGICLVAQGPSWPGPGAAGAPARHLERAHEGQKGQGIVALPGAGHPGQRPVPRIGEQVDLGSQPAPGAAHGVPVLVIRLSP